MSSDAALAVLSAAPPGSCRWAAALRATGDFATLAASSAQALARLGLSREAQRLCQPDTARIAAWRDWLRGPNRQLITLFSRAYPEHLAQLSDAPLALWAEGPRPDLLLAPQLAVVGSRNATAGGLALARQFAAELGTAGVTITSGLAAGIDAAAHTGALDTPGSTVAVLGAGIDRIYPRRNAGLAGEILRRGLIVSEYPPGSAPRPHQFPERNRIIAGLSLGTLVVEAAARSGSLITARLAADYGREVFAVPGSIHSAVSKGCHKLLRSGACLVETVTDVLGEIAPALMASLTDAPVHTRPEQAAGHHNDAAKLLKRMDFSPVSIAELAADTGLTTKDVSSMLLHLEMEGVVEALPGGRYCRLTNG